MGKRTRTVTAAILGAGLAATLTTAPISSAEIPAAIFQAAGTGSIGSLESLPTFPVNYTPTESDRIQVENQLKVKINDYRVRMALPRVTWKQEMDTSSRWWSEQIADLGKTGHSPWNTRPYTYGGENIWFGGGSAWDQAPDLALQSWIDSPGHNSNLMAQGVARAGLGMAWDDAKNRWIATYQFETP